MEIHLLVAGCILPSLKKQTTLPTAHCPHISEMAIADKDGKFKCQESRNLTDADLFSTEELAFFKETAMDEYGFDENMIEEC